MKKAVLFALGAAAAVSVQAQSNVRISGYVAVGYENYKLSDQGLNFKSENRLSDQSSRIIFSGEEDLGGGLKAWFMFDNRVITEMGSDSAGTAFVGGNNGVGLSSTTWGRVGLGRFDTHYNEGGAIEANRALPDQFSMHNALLAQVNGNNIARVSRASNSVRYDTPSFSGFNGSAGYSFNPMGNEGSGAANGSKDGAWFVAGRYTEGAINAGVSYWRYNVEGDVVNQADQRSTRGWFSYSFPFGLKVGVMIDQSKLRNLVTAGDFAKRTAWFIPVSYTFGNHAVYAKYGRAGDVSGTDNTGARQWGIGYDYALSKRTAIGASYSNLRNDSAATYDFKGVAGTNGATATGVGDDARQYYVGIKHSF